MKLLLTKPYRMGESHICHIPRHEGSRTALCGASCFEWVFVAGLGGSGKLCQTCSKSEMAEASKFYPGDRVLLRRNDKEFPGQVEEVFRRSKRPNEVRIIVALDTGQRWSVPRSRLRKAIMTETA